jgi:hypothetical protein
MEVLNHAHDCKTCISGLSPESSVIKKSTWQVFWLVPCLLPSHPPVDEQWPGVNNFRRIVCRTHSYGDSAGFTPDFPFNPDIAGTRFVQM